MRLQRSAGPASKLAASPAADPQPVRHIRTKVEAIGEDDTLVGCTKAELLNIEKSICESIAKTANPSDEVIPAILPHDEFAIWIRKINRTVPLEIFTTNYDILFERSFDNAWVPTFDGFVGAHLPFFFPECLEDEDQLPKSKWIRLWKLHGSVNWTVLNDESEKRIIRGVPADTGEMILPSHRKYDESRKQPYVSFMDRLTHLLNSEHSLLITCGYSFGDEHINSIIYGALDNRSTANVIALQYNELDESEDIVKEAVGRSNLTIIGRNGGVISGSWGEWRLTQPVDAKTCSFMDIGFDSKASPEDEGAPTADSEDLHGAMRLGDFIWFCRFLGAMEIDK